MCRDGASKRTGRRDRAWVFHSDNAFGSTVEFTQLYAATRRTYVWGERMKFHVRAEVGYTDADVEEFDLDIGGEQLKLSLTTLPNFYRLQGRRQHERARLRLRAAEQQ